MHSSSLTDLGHVTDVCSRFTRAWFSCIDSHQSSKGSKNNTIVFKTTISVDFYFMADVPGFLIRAASVGSILIGRSVGDLIVHKVDLAGYVVVATDWNIELLVRLVENHSSINKGIAFIGTRPLCIPSIICDQSQSDNNNKMIGK